jgi:E3 ubiquitin-protein ligase HUWE1
MAEHLLKIITFTESLYQICLCMKVLLKPYSCLDLAALHIDYLKSFLPRIIYLMKFFYEHTNVLNPEKIQLYDYFTDDPNYHKIATTKKEMKN